MAEGDAVSSAAEEKAIAFEGEALPHLDMVYRVALRYVGDPSEAEDLVQQTMLKAYRAWDQYRLGTNVRAWLLTILRNEAFAVHRRRKYQRNALEGQQIDGVTVFGRRHEAGPESRFLAESVDTEIVAAIDSLPVEFREAVVLRYVESLSYAEIAEVTGVRLGTVKSRLSRGRRLLRDRLHKYAVEMDYIDAESDDPDTRGRKGHPGK